MRAALPSGARVDAIGWERVHEWALGIRTQLGALEAAGAASPELCRFEFSYLRDAVRRFSNGNPGYYEYVGASPWGIFDDGGTMVGIHIARPATGKRKNAWGLYINHYLAFVRPECRQAGFGSGAEAELQRRWAEGGHDRLKTLCQSRLGVYYHEALADQVWGTNAKGELVIDSPLDPDKEFPPGVPMKARKEADIDRAAPLSADELLPIVTDPAGRFRMTTDEARALFARRAEGAGVEPARP